MKNLKFPFLVALLSLGLMLSACQGVNVSRAVDAGMDAGKAATASDAELKALSKQMREVGDKENKVAAAGSKYAKRLDKLVAKHKNEDGLDLNFKVYLTSDVNANATADGSIRVYSALMDMMTDAELMFIIGHEIGHVAQGHSLKAVRMAYASSAAIKGAGAVSGTVAALTDSQLGSLLHEVINAQFSQSQESDSDTYGFNFIKKYGYDTKAAGSALSKLAKLGGGGGMTSSHPDPASRAARMEKMAAGK